MVNHMEKILLLIAFDHESAKRCIDELASFCEVECCNFMEELEASNTEPASVLYLMDCTSVDHLHNIEFIRNKYPDKNFFVISNTVSIPLLQHLLRIGVTDFFISPLSNKDKHTFFNRLKNETNVLLYPDKIVMDFDLFCAQMIKNNPIGALLNIIERDYIKSPSLKSLSEDIYLSPSRICHIFKDLCGISYSSYLICRKIEEGERLLTLGENTVTFISYQIGFANPSHFCRSFKEHFNMTPTSYASGNRDAKQSEAFSKYLKLRAELFSNVVLTEDQNNEISPFGKKNIC
ncbi:AraC family transcriptional regulator [Psychromonas hadalis]|uniref:AraC family transcriptional regulator n=1 Tax=Psychromonas hadalis TaxID=211669 RepID=UPI0003B507B5|nr:helix-turn-helix domain-containing protein [Psychromonas hadalis]